MHRRQWFLQAGRGNTPPDPGKNRSNVEGDAGLDEWLGFCVRMVRHKGTVSIIHRSDRLDEILALLHGRLGGIVVFPLWPNAGKAAKRVLIRGRKGVRTPFSLSAGLILHRPDGTFTPEAEAVLRGGAGLNL